MPSRVGVRPIIYIDDQDSSSNTYQTDSDFAPILRLVSCERTCGGSLTDCAVIRRMSPVGKSSAPASGYAVGQSYVGKTCEVMIPDDGGFKPVHFGVIEQEQFSINAGGNDSHLISKLSPKLFGKPIFGQRQNQVNGSAQLRDQTMPIVAIDIVFNPMVEGNIRGNMRPQGDNDNDRSLFVDIESIRSADAITFQSMPAALVSQMIGLGETNAPVSVASWTLAQAVRYLCVEANQQQRYINNPTLQELLELFGETSDDDGNFNNSRAAILRNHVIPAGCYLPEALDTLLSPYGYTWFVDLLERGNRKIKIIKNNEGEQKTVKLQAFGANFNREQTNMESCDLTYEADDRLTELRVIGARKQVEATFELVPAWNEEDDSLDYELLSRDTTEWDEHPATHRVWRDWVLNEGGDYTSTRETSNKPCDLTPLLHHATGGGNEVEDNNIDTRSVQVKRRRFLPTLTLGEDGKPIGKIDGVTVEWLCEGEWLPIAPEEDPSWACRVLENECGISFVGNEPPLEILNIYEAASNPSSFPRIRVTATVELDTPIESTYSVGNPGGAPLSVLVYSPERFHSRYYHQSSGSTSTGIDSSIYLPHVQSGELHSTAMDSATAINAFAATVGANWARAMISGTFRLEGLDQLADYNLGDIITKIEGREITLNASIYGSDIYPQILGISYTAFDSQWTTLTVSAFRRTEQQIAEAMVGSAMRYRSPVHTRQDYR